MKKTTKIALIASFSITLALSTSYIILEQPKSFAKSNNTFDYSLDLVNKERATNGKSALVWNENLTKAANDKLDDMFKNQYFDHTSKDGTNAWQFIVTEGYEYKTAGENLGIDYSSVNEVFDAWKKSPTHYQNILSEGYEEYGFAQKEGVYDGKNTMMFVQIFASK